MGKKVFFQFTDNKTNLYHSIAQMLTAKDDISRVGAMVDGVDGYRYLQNQSDLDYEPLLCQQKVYNELIDSGKYSADSISLIENKYGNPTLWTFLLTARHNYEQDHEGKLRIIQNWFDFFESQFEQSKPDIFVTDDVGKLETVVPFQMVKQSGGKSMWWRHTRVKNIFNMSTSIDGSMRDIKEMYKHFKYGQKDISDYSGEIELAKSYVDDIRLKGKRPSYTQKENSQESIKNTVRTVLEYFYNYYVGDWKNDYTRRSPRKLFKRRLHNSINEKRIEFNNVSEINFTKKLILFPLHQQPEWTTTVIAPMYLDQPGLITQISRSLPVNYKLVVKEHPSMGTSRQSNFYERIKRLPNTYLVHPSVDSHKLIQQSELITTITGTAGLEGVIYKKPVIAFGRPHYSIMENVTKGGDPTQIDDMILETLNNHNHNEEDLLYYLTSVFYCGFKSQMPRTVSDEKLSTESKKICKEIMSFLDD